jgi:RNA polymerase-interacting CarD/CdnL/TRCF family regulator
MQKNESELHLKVPYSKINSKGIKDLVKLETMKLLKENTGEKLCDIFLGNDFCMTPKS